MSCFVKFAKKGVPVCSIFLIISSSCKFHPLLQLRDTYSICLNWGIEFISFLLISTYFTITCDIFDYTNTSICFFEANI